MCSMLSTGGWGHPVEALCEHLTPFDASLTAAGPGVNEE